MLWRNAMQSGSASHTITQSAVHISCTFAQCSSRMQRREDETRAAKLAADVRSLQFNLQTATPASSSPDHASHAAHAHQSAAAHLVGTAAARRRSQLDDADITAISKYIDQVRELRGTIADKESTISDLERGKRDSEYQYQLLSREHTAVLARMDELRAKVIAEPLGGGADGGKGGGSRLVLAQRTIEELRAELTMGELRAAEAAKARSFATPACHVQHCLHLSSQSGSNWCTCL
jgi:hypothetical protein